ncbi:MAG: ion transporter [Ignavibacteria bacterium]|nr:ion transporter [Ignavibacteria bacterium]MBT8381457.1 ion transporter [Ignavibacteria bacterium]MBT8391519.1 ion transporter [Ignavibacteria bacterium]NNJ52211.1 ion transporter [Ignavibacteriaceae bacterium]NNL22687.1 ion transporter [Ignavibacteriaceae bacterium]
MISDKLKPEKEQANWKLKVYEVIFEAETPSGKWFDVMLLWAIVLSVVVVFLESIADLKIKFGNLFLILEWMFTILFTIEYVLRIVCVNKPFRYILSFYGVIDLLAILPTYLSLLIVGSQYLLVIRILRLLRVFRIFKLTHLLKQANLLKRALLASRGKIAVFLFAVLTMIVVVGALMYVVEGPEHGFTSIPVSMYWTIVTMTTVGYGDISPQTPLGQVIASIVMIMGYAIIAVPTGIVSVEIADATRKRSTTEVCPHCLKEGHDSDAIFCKACGEKL